MVHLMIAYLSSEAMDAGAFEEFKRVIQVQNQGTNRNSCNVT